MSRTVPVRPAESEPARRRRGPAAALLALIAAGASAGEEAPPVWRVDTPVDPRSTATIGFRRPLPPDGQGATFAAARLSVRWPRGARVTVRARSFDATGYPPFLPMSAAVVLTDPSGRRSGTVTERKFGAGGRRSFVVRSPGEWRLEAGLRRRGRAEWLELPVITSDRLNEAPTVEIEFEAALPPVRSAGTRPLEFPACAGDEAGVTVRIPSGRESLRSLRLRVADAQGRVVTETPFSAADAWGRQGLTLPAGPFAAAGTHQASVVADDGGPVPARVAVQVTPDGLGFESSLSVDPRGRVFGFYAGPEGGVFECPGANAADSEGNDPTGARIELPAGALARESILRFRGGSYFAPTVPSGSRVAGPFVSASFSPRPPTAGFSMVLPSVRAFGTHVLPAAFVWVPATGLVAGEELDGGALRRVSMPAFTLYANGAAADPAFQYAYVDAVDAELGTAFHFVRRREEVAGVAIGGLFYELSADGTDLSFAGAIPVGVVVAPDQGGRLIGAADALHELDGGTLRRVGGSGSPGFPSELLYVGQGEPLATAEWGSPIRLLPDTVAGRFLLQTYDAGVTRVRLLDLAGETSSIVAGNWSTDPAFSAATTAGPLSRSARDFIIDAGTFAGVDADGRTLITVAGLPVRVDPGTGASELLVDAGSTRSFGAPRRARYAHLDGIGSFAIGGAGPGRLIATTSTGRAIWIDLAADRCVEVPLDPPGFVSGSIDAAWDARFGLLVLSPSTGPMGEALLALWRVQ